MGLELSEDDFDDSTNTLYDLLAAEDGIEADDVKPLITNAAAQAVEELYNQRDDLAERLADDDD
jgi:hypothetical protein